MASFSMRLATVCSCTVFLAAASPMAGMEAVSEGYTKDPSELFHMADLNFDHAVDRTEAQTYFFKTDRSPQVAEIQNRAGTSLEQLMLAIDGNNDGTFDIDEFLAYAEPAYHKQLGEEDFETSDADADGALSVEEFQSSSYANSRTYSDHDNGYDKHFKELDLNTDGSIQRDEFMTHAGLDRFSRADKDQDGFLSLHEYLAHDDQFYHTVEDPEEDNEQITNAFEDLDRNKDGKLSRAEDNMIYYTYDEDYKEFMAKKPVLASEELKGGL